LERLKVEERMDGFVGDNGLALAVVVKTKKS